MITINRVDNAHEGAPEQMHQHKVKVLMKATKPGSEDGINVKTFYENEEYSVSAELAAVFIEQNWAVDADAKAEEPAPPAPPAPETKKKNG